MGVGLINLEQCHVLPLIQQFAYKNNKIQ